ncbi:MAG: hypothetical protein HUU50_11685 [Candidatus Brocadiae bacterium]|nr:hypothetical protein [Candidatus Brocadiia bacterium]
MKTKIFAFLCLILVIPSLYAMPIVLKAISAGWDSTGYTPGGTAQLWVNGVDHSQHYRGMNVVVIDQFTGNVLNSNYYDTYAYSSSADAMAAFINALPSGRIVMIAAQDEPTQSMTSAGINSLYTLGASSFNPGYRGSWALIGIKGSAQGTQLQGTSARYSSAVILDKTMELVPEPSSLVFLLSSFVLFLAYKKAKR